MNSQLKLLLLIITTTLPLSSLATEVAKDDWVNAMSSALPTAFCAPQQYFRQCFSVTAEECEDTAASATRVCLKNNKDKIPGMLKQPKDGTKWGTIVGACAGQAYEIALISKRSSDPRCADPTQWQ